MRRIFPFHLALCSPQAFALIEGERLVNEGRLDAAEDIINLMFDNLKTAASDSALDLRKLCEERTHFASTAAPGEAR